MFWIFDWFDEKKKEIKATVQLSYNALLGAVHNNQKFKYNLHIKTIFVFYKAEQKRYH